LAKNHADTSEQAFSAQVYICSPKTVRPGSVYTVELYIRNTGIQMEGPSLYSEDNEASL